MCVVFHTSVLHISLSLSKNDKWLAIIFQQQLGKLELKMVVVANIEVYTYFPCSKFWIICHYL